MECTKRMTSVTKYILTKDAYWLVGMLLVSRSGLVEEDAVEMFNYYGFHLSSSFLMYNFKPTEDKNKFKYENSPIITFK